MLPINLNKPFNANLLFAVKKKQLEVKLMLKIFALVLALLSVFLPQNAFILHEYHYLL